jgi:hypothetical protein
MLKNLLLSLTFLIFLQTVVKAQNKSHPFTVNLSEDGKRYIKFGMNVQLWGRYSELNPGSKVGSNVTENTYDFVIRRLRLQAMGMLTEKVYFHVQLGQNNINFTQNSNPSNAPLSILDLLGEYHFSKKFQIGGGLCGYGVGTTRYSAQSSSSQLSLDAPIYQQNNISATFGNRDLSIYAKGSIGKFNYRAAITNPYQQKTSTLSTVSSVSTLTPQPQASGMLTYQFFDKESIEQPYTKATYLGTKKVLNVAVGYMYQGNAMWRTSETNVKDTIKSAMGVLGVDVFYDAPLNDKGSALTLYGAYNHCDYGKNYLRMVATPNPAASGTGTGFYGIGTGNIFYAQAGYLFNKRVTEDGKDKARLQIYADAEIASLEALKTPMSMYEVGLNYYLTGTFGPKISLGYQNRGIFKTALQTGETKFDSNGRRGMLVLQYQVSF